MKEKKKLNANDVVVVLGLAGGFIFFGSLLVNHFIIQIPSLIFLILDLAALALLVIGVIIYLVTHRKGKR